MAKSRGKRQMEIPGTEQKQIKEVTDAAEVYEAVRDKRMALTEKETAAMATLVEVMTKHKITAYKDSNAVPPLVVVVQPGKVKAKVSRIKEDE